MGALARLRPPTPLPLTVGFGSDPGARAAVGAVADSIIVGSALIDAYAGSHGDDAARKAGGYVRSLRAALPRR
jgi:tryptophan synthase alpha chain